MTGKGWRSVAVASILWPMTVRAQEQTPNETYQLAGKQLGQCYFSAADNYGSKSCQPPSDLAEAAFGVCTSRENIYSDQTDQQMGQGMGKVAIARHSARQARPIFDAASLRCAD